MKKKGEPQYQDSIRAYKQRGYERLGLMSSWAWNEDPKRLVFTLSRYKFVAKMLDGCRDVLEVGCADAFGSRIVAQATGRLTALDFDPDFVQAARDIQPEEWRFDVIEHDIMEKPVDGRFDGIYSLDVYEHIPADRQDTYIRNMCRSLAEHGVLIIGTPSLESQAHAS